MTSNLLSESSDLETSYAESLKAQEAEQIRRMAESLDDPVEEPAEEPEGFGFQGESESSGDIGEDPKEPSISPVELLKQITLGPVSDTVTNFGELVTDTGQNVRDAKIPGFLGGDGESSIQDVLDSGDDFLQNIGLLDEDSRPLGGRIFIELEKIEKKGGPGVQMTRGVLNWAMGMLMFRGMGGGVIKAGVASDVMAVDRDRNLSTLFNEYVDEDNVFRKLVTKHLASDINDSELANGIRNAIEGGLLAIPLAMIPPIVRQVREMKEFRVRANKAKKRQPELADEVEPEVRQEVDAPTPKVEKTFAVFDGKEFEVGNAGLDFSKINSPEAIEKAVKASAKLFKKGAKNAKGRDIRRLTQVEAEGRKKLEANPISETKRILELNPAEDFKDSDIVEAFLISDAANRRVLQLSDEFVDTGSAEAAKQGKDAFRLAAVANEQFMRFKEAGGRGTGAFRIFQQADEELARGRLIRKEMQEMFDEADINMSNESLMSKLQDVDVTDEKVMREFLTEYSRLGLGKMVFEAWINSLFGFKTIARNIVGNMSIMSMEVMERHMAGQIAKVQRGFRPNQRFIPGMEDVAEEEGMAMLFGHLMAQPMAIRMLAKNSKKIVTGEEVKLTAGRKLPIEPMRALNSKNIPGLENPQTMLEKSRAKVFDFNAHLLTTTGKTLLATDEYFKFLGYNMEVSARAVRRARREGLEGQAYSDRVSELMGSPPVDIVASANDFARIVTFTEKLGSMGQAGRQFINQIPMARIVVPFYSVLVNIAKAEARRTPLALGSSGIRKTLAEGGAKGQIAQARIAAGSSAVLALITLAMGGAITGRGPSNKIQREAWLRTNRPFSVKVGFNSKPNTWASYEGADPARFFMAISSRFVEFGGEMSEGEREDFAKQFTQVMSDGFLSATFAKSIGEATNMVLEGDFRLLENLAGSVLPFQGMLADIEKSVDPVRRDFRTTDPDVEIMGEGILENKFRDKYGVGVSKNLAKGIRALWKALNRIESRLPGRSKNLPAYLNTWGEETTLSPGLGAGLVPYLGRLITPFNLHTIKDSPIDQWINKLKAPVGQPDSSLTFPIAPGNPNLPGTFKVDLSPEEYHDFLKFTGIKAKKVLNAFVTQPGFGSIPDVDKVKRITGVMEDFHDLGKMFLQTSTNKKTGKSKYPEFIRRLNRNRQQALEELLQARTKVTLQPTDL